MKRGSVLIAVLTLVSIFALLGMALLQKQRLAYQGATQTRQGIQAQALAEAGLEDARVKLEKDRFFPPPSANSQKLFSYGEEVFDMTGTRKVGSYFVTIDRSRCEHPYFLLRVQSVGSVGEGTDATSRRRLLAEFDVCPHLRGDDSQPNPTLYERIRVVANDVPLGTP